MGFYIAPDDVAKYIPLFRSLSVWWQLVIVVALMALIFGCLGWRFGRAFYAERLKFYTATLDEYREKLKGLSPTEASDQLRELKITVQELQERQWRQITAEQRQRFRDTLQGERPEIWRIYCVMADSEADGYTKQLMKMIRDCGIVINDHPDKDEKRPEFDTHGLVILVKNASALAPNALTLTVALNAANIVYHLTALRVGRSAPDNYLALRIGPKAK